MSLSREPAGGELPGMGPVALEACVIMEQNDGAGEGDDAAWVQ